MSFRATILVRLQCIMQCIQHMLSKTVAIIYLLWAFCSDVKIKVEVGRCPLDRSAEKISSDDFLLHPVDNPLLSTFEDMMNMNNKVCKEIIIYKYRFINVFLQKKCTQRCCVCFHLHCSIWVFFNVFKGNQPKKPQVTWHDLVFCLIIWRMNRFSIYAVWSRTC